jgi:hypothetical protein
MSHHQGPETEKETEARRNKQRRATGPRTEAGKRRMRFNALKHGIYARTASLEEIMNELGEDPQDFRRLTRELMEARQPADAIERMLVEEIAVLLWKKARLDRTQGGMQVRSLQLVDLERTRQAREVGRENYNGLQAEVRARGLRQMPDSAGKFEEMLAYLDVLLEMARKRDEAEDPEPALRALYGDQPTLRGAQIANLYRMCREARKLSHEDEALERGLELAIMEERHDVQEEYELFLEDHLRSTRAARNAGLAPAYPQWTTLLRQENQLHRQIERKLRLLEEIQERRRARAQAEASRDNDRKASDAAPQPALEGPNDGKPENGDIPRRATSGARSHGRSAAKARARNTKDVILQKQTQTFVENKGDTLQLPSKTECVLREKQRKKTTIRVRFATPDHADRAVFTCCRRGLPGGSDGQAPLPSRLSPGRSLPLHQEAETTASRVIREGGRRVESPKPFVCRTKFLAPRGMTDFRPVRRVPLTSSGVGLPIQCRQARGAAESARLPAGAPERAGAGQGREVRI